jgi:seryl-tRNA synthetase
MSGGQPIDSLADALGQVVARERTNWQRAFAEERETWRREAERRDAEARALLAEKTLEALNLRRELDTLVQEHMDRFKEMRKEFGSAYASIERGFADAFGRNVDKLTVLYDRVETRVTELQDVRTDVLSRVDDVTARLDDRLATVRDGRDADPAQFEALAASLSERVDARLATVRDGVDADPAQFDALADAIEQKVGRSLAEMKATADAGRDGLDALMQSSGREG